MDIRKIIVGLMILVFVIVLFVPVKATPEEKRCIADEDCAFVSTVCCPSCEGGFDSVNVQYADKMNLESYAKCTETQCPPLYCENPYGESYTAKPACIDKACSTKSELKCTAVCSYLEKKDRNPYSIYIQNVVAAEGQSINALADRCEC